VCFDVLLWFVPKGVEDSDHGSIGAESDMSLVSSVNSSDDIDMLHDAACLADGLRDAS